MSLLDGADAEYYASSGGDGRGGGAQRRRAGDPQGGSGTEDGGEDGAARPRRAEADASATGVAGDAAARLRRRAAASATDAAAIAGVLAGLAVRERPPDDADIERLVGDALSGSAGAPGGGAAPGSAAPGPDGPGGPPPRGGRGGEDAAPRQAPIADMLRSMGYLRERSPGGGDPRWLTRRGFAAVGDRILRDVVRGMGPHGFGPHEAAAGGAGSSEVSGQARRLEPGEAPDAGRIDAVRTVLNAVSRAGSSASSPASSASADPFPVDIDPSDIEVAETARDAGAAVVYCIDLSSTMKYRLGGPGGPSRIEAAKRALWALCALARRRFPADSVSIVAFASLAARVAPEDVPHLRTFEAGDENLHYTNYQAALRLASRILDREAAGRNRRIVLVTDGQPSACLVETPLQRARVLSAKPYANLYVPGREAVGRIGRERAMDFGGAAGGGGAMVYLCYRHKRIDPVIDECTVREARRCARRGARIDTIVVSDEPELVEYAGSLERRLGGVAYHVSGPGMDRLVVRDYLRGARRP